MEKITHRRKAKSPILKKNQFENSAWERNQLICGIDEVGRGCLAGPVFAAAVILPPGARYRYLQDSKILTEAERVKAYSWIINNGWYGIGIADHRTIDRHNIWQATLIAMKRALLHLLATRTQGAGASAPEPTKFESVCPGILSSESLLSESLAQVESPHSSLVGAQSQVRSAFGITAPSYARLLPEAIVIDAMPLSLADTSFSSIPVHHFPKGESLSISIAAASIVAKVARDRLMQNAYAPLFPGYGLAQHKGYATPVHRDAVSLHGESFIHRASFCKNIDPNKNIELSIDTPGASNIGSGGSGSSLDAPARAGQLVIGG